MRTGLAGRMRAWRAVQYHFKFQVACKAVLCMCRLESDLLTSLCVSAAPYLCSACDEIVTGAGRAKREVDSSRHGLKTALRCGRGVPSAASYAVRSVLSLTV